MLDSNTHGLERVDRDPLSNESNSWHASHRQYDSESLTRHTKPRASSPEPFSFRPRRLLHSISHALAPRVCHHDISPPPPPPPSQKPIQHRRSLWEPVSSFVSSMNARLRVPTYDVSASVEHIQPHSTPAIDQRGRFNIGHPTSCTANIEDEEIIGREANFVNGIPTAVHTGRGQCVSDGIASRKTSNSTDSCIVIADTDVLRNGYDYPSGTMIIVRINVSGVLFFVLLSTLRQDPFVYGKFLEDALWLPEQREYYFERDPTVFRFVHTYLRRGEVHLPYGMCGPLIEKELDDWGIPLGLDIQRCCLGPVMDTKFKLESLQKFEEKLEPKYVPPNSWIRSASWQVFRAKVWRIIGDVSRFSTRPLPTHCSSSSDPVEPAAFFDTPTVADTGNTDSQTVELKQPKSDPESSFPCPETTQQNGYIVRDQCDMKTRTSKSESTWIGSSSPHGPTSSDHYTDTSVRWLRRFYVIYETMTVTAAVIVFMLSTCAPFRVPVNSESNPLHIANLSEVLNDVEASYIPTHYTSSVKGNGTQFTLPVSAIVTIDIFLSIVITVDVLAKMVFCPALRPWFFSWYTLIDVLSLIPFYCELILYEMIHYNAFADSNRWLSLLMRVENYVVVLKVFVVLRLFRILRRHRGTRVLLYTIRTTIIDLAIIVVLILESALFFGAAIYFTDDNFRDIPTGFWWALITMSTVGYGDLVPSHTFGYGVAMVCVIIGTLLMSYTIPILVNHFLLYYQHADQLYMMKQLHRTAKRKANRRTMSRYALKALSSAKGLVNATLTRSMARVSSSIQSIPRVVEISDIEQCKFGNGLSENE